MLNKNNIEKIYSFIMAALSIIGLCFFMYSCRGKIVYEGDRALYMDDMAMYKVMTNPDTTSWQKIADTSANKVRYVTNAVMVVVWKIIGTDYEKEDSIMMFVNIAMCLFMWGVLYSLSRRGKSENNITGNQKRLISIFLAGGGTIVFAASRFAYYSYEELFGIMENMGNVFVFLFVTLLIIDNFKFTWRYWIASIVWIISVYVHERYLVLAGVLVAYSVLASIYTSKKLFTKEFVFREAVVVVIFAQRLFLFGNRALDGTGGTSITDTFSLRTILEMLGRELFYLVGLNPPCDAYLNGIALQSVSIWICICTIIVWGGVLVVMVFFAKTVAKIHPREWCKMVLFAITIAALTASTIITIRVEMRWLYASLGIEIMSIVYMLSYIFENTHEETGILKLKSVSIICVLMSMIIESYYVGHWNVIYNWGIRNDASELSDEFDKYNYIDNLYIVSDVQSPMGDLGIKDLADAEELELNNIIWVSDIKSIDYVGTNDVVLLRDETAYDYYDLTEKYMDISYVSGWYEDAWCETDVMVDVWSRGNETLHMAFYIPDYEILGDGGTTTIYINGEKCGVHTVTRNSVTEIVVDGLKEGKNAVELVSDFWVIEDSGRSEDGRLSYVLSDFSIMK